MVAVYYCDFLHVMTISESAGKGADIKSGMNRQVAVARVATIPATLLAPNVDDRSSRMTGIREPW